MNKTGKPPRESKSIVQAQDSVTFVAQRVKSQRVPESVSGCCYFEQNGQLSISQAKKLSALRVNFARYLRD